jgi:hypothetical protein
VARFLHRPQNRCRGPRASLGDELDERTQPFQGQLLDALALCGRDPLKAPHKAVRHFDESEGPVDLEGLLAVKYRIPAPKIQSVSERL